MLLPNSSASHKPLPVNIVRFPQRARFDIRIEHEEGGFGWLVLTHDRQFGWLHAEFASAQQDAGVIARGYGVGVTSSAGRVMP
jgi:hypothetical protein